MGTKIMLIFLRTGVGIELWVKIKIKKVKICLKMNNNDIF